MKLAFFLFTFILVGNIPAQSIEIEEISNIKRGSVGIGIGLPSAINSTISYRILQQFGLDFGIGTFFPASASINYAVGINAYMGKHWDPDVIFSAHFILVRFPKNNLWQTFSFGVGNVSSKNNFYWRVGIFYFKYVNSDSYNSVNNILPHFDIGWNFAHF